MIDIYHEIRATQPRKPGDGPLWEAWRIFCAALLVPWCWFLTKVAMGIMIFGVWLSGQRS